MAFKLENFGSEVANIKSILGGRRLFKYNNPDGDTLTTAGYFPAKLGLKLGDEISVKETDSDLAVVYYVKTIANGVVTCEAEQ